MMIDEIRQEFEALQAEIADGPIYPNVAAEQVRAYLASRFDFRNPLPLEDVIADVQTMLKQWQVQVTHPRYFGLFNPSVMLASVIADTLVAMYNPQLANWRTSPAANEIERHTLGWLAAKFGYPADSICTFTSGGMEANLSAMVVALTHRFPEYGEHGLRSLSGLPVFYVTREAHNGYNKLAHVTGLGRRSLHIVPTSPDLKMNVEELRTQIAQDRAQGHLPFMVVGTAGGTATGVIDPLPELAEFCRETDLWLHVDAAWGGAAILSSKLSHHLAGIEHADSITCDAHKWISVPMGAGMFFCRYPESVGAAFRAEISYMPTRRIGPVFDPLSNSMQWSRRFIGLKFFMALAEQGEAGYANKIEHMARMGDLLRTLLNDSGWQILNSTPLPLLCFTRPGLDTSRFLEILRERQIAWMTGVQISDTPVIRACITSFLTDESEIRWVVDAMNQVAEELELKQEAELAYAPQGD